MAFDGVRGQRQLPPRRPPGRGDERIGAVPVHDRRTRDLLVRIDDRVADRCRAVELARRRHAGLDAGRRVVELEGRLRCQYRSGASTT
jgi:hypothetical protein